MTFSVIASFLTDIDAWLNDNMGTTGIAVLICMFSMMALLLFANLCKASINQPKLVIKWGQLLLLIMLVVAVVYMCTTL